MMVKGRRHDISTYKLFQPKKQYSAILVAKHDVRKGPFWKVRGGFDTRSMKKVGFPCKEHRPQVVGWLAGWLAGWRVGGLAGWRVGWL